MKFFKITLITLSSILLTACGGGQKEKIVGEWSLTGFSDNGNKIELTECDKNTTWNFTKEDTEPLGDGTKVHILKGSAPSDCKYYGFDSKWTVKDGELFVSTSRIGGMGGNSMAGMMEIVEITDNKLILNTMNKEITLER